MHTDKHGFSGRKKAQKAQKGKRIFNHETGFPSPPQVSCPKQTIRHRELWSRNTRKPDRPVDGRLANDTHQVVRAAGKLSNGKICRRHFVLFSRGSCFSWFKRMVPAEKGARLC